MFASCDHRIREWFPADKASKRQHVFIFLITIILLVILSIMSPCRALLPLLLTLLPFLLELPPRLVVPSVMQEDTRISIATVACLLVVLADVGNQSEQTSGYL